MYLSTNLHSVLIIMSDLPGRKKYKLTVYEFAMSLSTLGIVLVLTNFFFLLLSAPFSFTHSVAHLLALLYAHLNATRFFRLVCKVTSMLPSPSSSPASSSSSPPSLLSPSLWSCSAFSYILSACQKPYKGPTQQPQQLQQPHPQPRHRTALCGEDPEFSTYELRLERGIDCDPVFFSSSDWYSQTPKALILIGNM